MAAQSEPKTLEFPPNFYVGHMIGRGGQTIRDMEELTGAIIKVVPTIGMSEKFVVITEPPEAVQMAIKLPKPLVCGLYGGNRQHIQISGAPTAIQLAEELIMALYKFENPSEFSDGLKKTVVICKLHQLLTPNSVLATKVGSCFF